MNPTNKRILCLKLPSWPVQRAERARSQEPAVKAPAPALLLHSRDPRRGNCVAACSPEAEAWGVRAGMPLAEASALARRGGRFVAQAHNGAADLAELARLAEICERFSPCVGWETVDAASPGAASSGRARGEAPPPADWWPPTGPQHLFLDITGIGRLFGGEDALLTEVHRELGREGYEITAACGETIGGAWGSPEIMVPCAALRLPPATLSLLAQLGITRVDELLRLPRESLRSRFGPRLLLRLDQLRGLAQESIVPHHPPPRFQAEWILEYPTDSRELVERIIAQLLGQISADLAERQEGVVQLACRLDGAGGRPVHLSVGLFRPSAQREHLRELLAMQLEQTRLPRQIGRIGLAARLTAPLENRQTELFAGSERETSRDYALLVDRLAGRLGPAAVLQPVLRPDPLPERAVSYAAVVGKKKAKRNRDAGGKAGRRRSASTTIQTVDAEASLPPAAACLLPLFLHHPPLPLSAVSVVPNGPPISFEFQNQTHRVVRSWGPERIEAGWWRGRSQRRDYYRVETAAGCRYWLFRRLADGKWHLQGEYG